MMSIAHRFLVDAARLRMLHARGRPHSHLWRSAPAADGACPDEPALCAAFPSRHHAAQPRRHLADGAILRRGRLRDAVPFRSSRGVCHRGRGSGLHGIDKGRAPGAGKLRRPLPVERGARPGAAACRPLHQGGGRGARNAAQSLRPQSALAASMGGVRTAAGLRRGSLAGDRAECDRPRRRVGDAARNDGRRHSRGDRHVGRIGAACGRGRL